MKRIKIVTIGGGTGTFALLSGLKHYPQLEITAVVNMTDNGGSTGRLRDEFGTLPIGDARLSMVALAEEGEAGKVLRNLFNYRFPDSNSSLAGHNFGNLFLTALTDIYGTEAEAIRVASEILAIKGRVLPVTTDNADLVAEYDDGSVLYGEKNIDSPSIKQHNCETRVRKLWIQPKAKVYSEAANAMAEADFIIMGPGDLYSSLLSNVVVEGVADIISNSKAKFVYIMNMVTKYGQTHNYSQTDFAVEIEKYCKRKPDYFILNDKQLPADILQSYAAEESYPVADDMSDENYNVIRADLLAEDRIARQSGDKIKRSLIRHDNNKLALTLLSLIDSYGRSTIS